MRRDQYLTRAEQRRQTVRDMLRAGRSVAEISRALLISTQRVYQLRDELGLRSEVEEAAS